MNQSDMVEIYDKLRSIRFLLLDVDGVLTNGEILLGGKKQELKIYDVQDGLGIHLLSENGIEVGILTGRKSDSVVRRASELNIKIVYQGCPDKLKGFQKILNRHRFHSDEVCYMGDDFPDIPVMKKAGFSVSVANGRNEVKAVADLVTVSPGGRGAVREIAELILQSQGKWENIIEKYEEIKNE